MSRQYDSYLATHITNVHSAMWALIDALDTVQDFGDEVIKKALENADKHDESKWSVEEYGPYDDHFYGRRNDEDGFDLAWLHHIHNNPHHWQYWVLINDDDGTVALEMPKEYVLEMIADWWSFSWKSLNLNEIFEWYDGHKETMILHPNTRQLVETMLAELREKI